MEEDIKSDLFEQFNKFLKLTQKESDRSLALLVAAFMEEWLGKLLLEYLMNVSSAKDLVEGFNAPLGTFSSRIKAAHALGLLNDQQHRDIEKIRKIRNEFAHNWELTSFEEACLIGLVKDIAPSRIHPPREKYDSHHHFHDAASMLLIEIQLLTAQIRNDGLRLGPRSIAVHTEPYKENQSPSAYMARK